LAPTPGAFRELSNAAPRDAARRVAALGSLLGDFSRPRTVKSGLEPACHDARARSARVAGRGRAAGQACAGGAHLTTTEKSITMPRMMMPSGRSHSSR